MTNEELLIKTQEEKEKTIEKWSKLGLTDGLSGQYVASVDPATNTFDIIQFPMIRRVMSGTIAGGGTYKSEKQKLKESRLNKLRQLQGEEPNIILPDDIVVEGLVPVQPLSTPTGNLFYVDYKYGETEEEKRKKKQVIRKEKLENLFGKDKIKYIGKLKNNFKKWMT